MLIDVVPDFTIFVFVYSFEYCLVGVHTTCPNREGNYHARFMFRTGLI